MSLYRSHGRGSFVVERTLLGVAIRRRTGCFDRLEAVRVEETLLLLARHGRRALIEAFDRGYIMGPELVAAVEEFGLGFNVTVERTKRLSAAVEEWLKHAELADSTRRDYRNGLATLQRRHKRATMADLPVLLARYARHAKPVMFRQVKAAAQSLVSATVPKGQHSDLWRDVASVRGPRLKRRRVVGGLPPETARAVAEQLGRLGPMWWTLCTTGMGRKEYWETPWEVLPDRILVHGTKRERRDRTVPRISTPVRPLAGPKLFATALQVAAEKLHLKRLTIYTGRRTFAHFLERARIPESRCDAYMGHSPKTLRDLYREHEVEPYLAEDTNALRASIGGDPVYVRAVG